MILLVTGGRDFKDVPYIYKILDKYHEERRFSLVVHGGARGVDRIAGKWGHSRGVQPVAFEAMWDYDGAKHAGLWRNKRMIKAMKPDLVIAFPGGTGTANMMKLAFNMENVELIDTEDLPT